MDIQANILRVTTFATVHATPHTPWNYSSTHTLSLLDVSTVPIHTCQDWTAGNCTRTPVYTGLLQDTCTWEMSASWRKAKRQHPKGGTKGEIGSQAKWSCQCSCHRKWHGSGVWARQFCPEHTTQTRSSKRPRHWWGSSCPNHWATQEETKSWGTHHARDSLC